MKLRAYGFYWVRLRNGDEELFVAEYRGAPVCWEMTGTDEWFTDEEIEVVSERLVPPHVSHLKMMS